MVIQSRYANGNGSVVAFCLCTNFDGREPESQLAKDIDRKVFEARNNKQWRREYMSYQMELDKQYRNGEKKVEKKEWIILASYLSF